MDEQKIAKKLVEAVENARLEAESQNRGFGHAGPDSLDPDLAAPSLACRAAYNVADGLYNLEAGDAEKELRRIKEEADAAFNAVFTHYSNAVTTHKATVEKAQLARAQARDAADLAYNAAKNEITMRRVEERKAVNDARRRAERDLVLAVIGGPWKNKPWKYGAKRTLSRVFRDATGVIAELRLDLFNARRMLPDRPAEGTSARLYLRLFSPILVTLTTERVEGATLAEALHNAEDVAIEDGWYTREPVSTPEESGR